MKTREERLITAVREIISDAMGTDYQLSYYEIAKILQTVPSPPINFEREKVAELLDNISGLAIDYDCLAGEENMKGLIDCMATWAREALHILKQQPNPITFEQAVGNNNNIYGSSNLCSDTSHVFIWGGGGTNTPMPDGIACCCGKTISHVEKCKECGSLINKPKPDGGKV